MFHKFDGIDAWLISDGLFEPSVDALIHADGEAALAASKRAWGQDTLPMNINLMLLRTRSEFTLIDTGLGEAWQGRFGKARDFMRTKGVGPSDVKRVFLTHIHSDHALGLFDGDIAYFPDAVIFAPAGDLTYYTDRSAMEATPVAKREPFEITARLLSIYGAKVLPIYPGRIEDGMEAIHLPGHSPGHMGYLIGETLKLLTVGDAIHVPALQIGDPKLGVRYDHDPSMAAATRIELLSRAERSGWLLTGGHMDGLNELRQEDGRFVARRLSEASLPAQAK